MESDKEFLDRLKRNCQPVLDVAEREWIDHLSDGPFLTEAEATIFNREVFQQAVDKLKSAPPRIPVPVLLDLDYSNVIDRVEGYFTCCMMLEGAARRFLNGVRESHGMTENEPFRCPNMNQLDSCLADLEELREKTNGSATDTPDPS